MARHRPPDVLVLELQPWPTIPLYAETVRVVFGFYKPWNTPNDRVSRAVGRLEHTLDHHAAPVSLPLDERERRLSLWTAEDINKIDVHAITSTGSQHRSHLSCYANKSEERIMDA
jgi:hypothetical protein